MGHVQMNIFSIRFVVLVALLLALSACAGKSTNQVSRQAFETPTVSSSKRINQEINESALLARANSDSQPYVLGHGDKLSVAVFRVDELNSVIRLNAEGFAILPLLGRVKLGGLTVLEAEDLIAKMLSKDYIQNPQVSLFVEEYRSQEITIMGEVKTPNIYNVERPRSILELLSMAGGVSDNAADLIRVSTSELDPNSGERVRQNLLIDINAMLANGDSLLDLRLSGGDSIYVPEAGVVYIEGAVEKPGAYKIAGNLNLMQALSLAGGAEWAANQNRVRIIRNINQSPKSLQVSVAKIRDQKEEDVALKDGDIVVVEFSGIKKIASRFMRGVDSIVGFGYSLN